MKIPFRVQEWLTDRTPAAQYPRFRRRSPRRLLVDAEEKLPWWKAIVLLQWFLLAGLIGAAMLGIGVLVAIIFIRSISA
jgi:hypothetical protein